MSATSLPVTGTSSRAGGDRSRLQEAADAVGATLRSCTMIAINIIETALIVAAAVLIAAAICSRGRAGMMLLSAGLLSVLIVLALQINSEWMTDLDTLVRKWFTTHEGSKGLRNASRQLFAFIGRPLHVAIAAVLSGMLLAWKARSPLRAVVVIGAVGTGALLERVFKALVTRTPDNLSKLYDASPQDLAQITEHAHTFPSGHVIGTATLLGMIAVCASVGHRLSARTTWAAFVLFGVLFVAALALFVHAHLFADVIGGMALGGSIVAAGAALINALHPIERRKRPTLGS